MKNKNTLVTFQWLMDKFLCENYLRLFVFGKWFQVHADHRFLQWVGKQKESSTRVTTISDPIKYGRHCIQAREIKHSNRLHF